MRRILYYSLVCLLWVSVNSCKDDEASQPPTPTFSVDRQSGLYNSTEFTFTVDQIGSNAVSLLPYGADHPNDAGILIPASSFTNGKATVKFVYSKVGTFNAIVVANNHTGDGLSVKNTLSNPTAITITSNRTAITDFTFKTSTKTVIDTVAHTITVTVPAGTDVSNLEATITKSDFSTISGGGNNYTSPVVYTVKSQDNAQTTNWTVTVNVTPREKTNMFKSFQGLLAKKGKTAGRVLPADIDSAGNKIVIYDTLGANPAKYDSIALDYALKGTFAHVIEGTYSATGPKVGVKDTVSLVAPIKLTVVPQDSALSAPDGNKTFDVYFRVAPRLMVSLNADKNGLLHPPVSGTAKEYELTLDVLNGTDVKTLETMLTFTAPPLAASTFGAIRVNGATFVNGGIIDFTKPVTIQVAVTQNGITFWAAYKVTVTVVK